MNQSINTDSKNSNEPQQKYRLGTVSIKILGGLNRFYRRLTSPSASIMAQNIQLFKFYLLRFTFFSQPYGYFMDTIKSFCTEQNQTDYRNFDTGITVIFVMQNLLFWKWWIFPWFSRPSVSYGVFPIPVRK